jgi:hypothetical protein
MNIKFYVIVFIVITLLYLCLSNVEHFWTEEGMLVFKRLNGSLIKKFKINTSINLSDSDITNLFKKYNDPTIRIIIPPNHDAQLIYRLKSGGYSNTIDLPNGTHDIRLNIRDQILDQIDVTLNYQVTGNNIIVVNKLGETLFTTNSESNINWDSIYTDYGLDDYYIVNPWGRRVYYYYNYPYYYRYRRFPYSSPYRSHYRSRYYNTRRPRIYRRK